MFNCILGPKYCVRCQHYNDFYGACELNYVIAITERKVGIDDSITCAQFKEAKRRCDVCDIEVGVVMRFALEGVKDGYICDNCRSIYGSLADDVTGSKALDMLKSLVVRARENVHER